MLFIAGIIITFHAPLPPSSLHHHRLLGGCHIGFMEARKHAHKFVMLAELMYADSKMACFLGMMMTSHHIIR